MKNSDLLYILQFKIIDEVSAILEDLVNEIRFLSNSKNKKDGLLNDFNKDYKKEISHNLDHLYRNLIKIDEMNAEFRASFKEWTKITKTDVATYGITNAVTAKTSLGGLSYGINSGKESFQYSKNKTNLRAMSQDSSVYFSTENTNNINISVFFAFIYMLSFSIILPSNAQFMKSIGYDITASGLVMAFTPFGQLISFIVLDDWLLSSYRHPMLMSVICLFLGSFLYCLSSIYQDLVICGVGRLLLGFGSGRLLVRNYMITFLPPRKVSKYLLYSQISGMFGIASGPLFNILIVFVTEVLGNGRYFNQYINPVWSVCLVSFCFIIAVMFGYTEPIKSDFHILRENLHSVTEGMTMTFQTISDRDKKMVNYIDRKLGQINQQNNFSDTNLVSKNIEMIAWRENKTTSYLYKCFIVFIFILFTCRVYNL
jgi:hypothetical protein